MIDLVKYLRSKKHYISNCGHDERGKYKGGQAGDQTGGEYCLRVWYSRPWNMVFRYPTPAVRECIARLSVEAALNNHIGYNQSKRTTFWSQLRASDYYPSKISVNCDADCSSSTAAIIKAVGYLMDIPKLQQVPVGTTTSTMRVNLLAAGFTMLTSSKYLATPDYLLPGDILLYETHHAAINVTYGSKVTTDFIDSPVMTVITGKTVNIRSGPSTDYKIIKIAKRGDSFPYTGEYFTTGSGWYKISLDDENGFVSAKFSRIVEMG